SSKPVARLCSNRPHDGGRFRSAGKKENRAVQRGPAEAVQARLVPGGPCDSIRTARASRGPADYRRTDSARGDSASASIARKRRRDGENRPDVLSSEAHIVSRAA